MENDLPFERRQVTRRRFVELTFGAGAGLVLAGCGGTSAEEATEGGDEAAETGAAGAEYTGPNVNLQFWNGFAGRHGPVMRDMVDRFNTEHPNIKVKMVVQQ